MIKAIIFDVDGVLIDSLESNFKFFRGLMTRAGYKPPTKKEFVPIFHFTMEEAIHHLIKSESKHEVKRIWEMGKNEAIETSIGSPPMSKGAAKVIKNLTKKFSLAIVSGRIKEGIYESRELEKLRKYFKVTVSCDDTAKHKPNPDPLLFASKKLNIKPEECVYVGDVENDIIAGHKAGMKVILYSENKIKGADAQAYNFLELPEIISKL